MFENQQKSLILQHHHKRSEFGLFSELCIAKKSFEFSRRKCWIVILIFGAKIQIFNLKISVARFARELFEFFKVQTVSSFENFLSE